MYSHSSETQDKSQVNMDLGNHKGLVLPEKVIILINVKQMHTALPGDKRLIEPVHSVQYDMYTMTSTHTTYAFELMKDKSGAVTSPKECDDQDKLWSHM